MNAMCIFHNVVQLIEWNRREQKRREKKRREKKRREEKGREWKGRGLATSKISVLLILMMGRGCTHIFTYSTLHCYKHYCNAKVLDRVCL